MKFDLDLLGKSKYLTTLSGIVLLVGAVFIYFVGLNLGIDFTGGTQFTIQFQNNVGSGEVRNVISKIDPVLANSKIQDIEGQNKKSITTKLDVSEDQDILDQVEGRLQDSFSVVEGGVSRRSVGTQISEELQRKGWQAILLALLVTLIYISWRFRLRYAVGAVFAVIHDVTIALAIFALFKVEINLPTIGAFLTIVGYSLNDTIVYFDRIRENEGRRGFKDVHTFKLINTSINQSLPRTLGTSATTFIPVFALFLFGGPVLKPFSLALLIGVLVGTYSSIYIASPIVYLWDKYLSRE